MQGASIAGSSLGNKVETAELLDGAVTDKKLNSQMQAEHELEIIELQANASITPVDHDTLISEAFSDTTGYNDYVDTGNTDATFDTNKYKRGVPSSPEAHGVALTDGSTAQTTSRRGIKIYIDVTMNVGTVTKKSTCTADTCYIVEDPTGTPVEIANAAFSGNDATFSSIELTSGKTYGIGCKNSDDSSASHPYSTDGQTEEDTGNIKWQTGWRDGSTDNRFYSIESVSAESTTSDNIVQIDIPTISGTVLATQLVVNDTGSREDGDSITYDLVGADASEDADLAIDTKNSLTNVGGDQVSGGVIKINLIAKDTNPTAGIPAIYSFSLKVWK